jgi:hypothetical protein
LIRFTVNSPSAALHLARGSDRGLADWACFYATAQLLSPSGYPV